MNGVLGLAVAAALAVPAGWVSAWAARRFDGTRAPTWAMIGLCLAVFVSAVPTRPGVASLAAGFGLGWTLLTLAAVDLAILRLPDPLTLPLIAAGLAAAFVLPGRSALDAAIGAATGYAVLAAIGWAFWRARGLEGLGLGDAKLMAVAGAWLGWRALPATALVACALALAWIGVRIARRGRESSREPVAFGPPLCLAIWVGWLTGGYSA